LGLLSTGCVVAPIAYQDGLSATTPAPGFAAARLEYNRWYWRHDSIDEAPEYYLTGGLRFGQEWRQFSFEQGLTAIYYPEVLLPCIEGGIGLRDPAVTLRALWTPVAVGGRISFNPKLWWQFSGLIGTPRKIRGFGVSYGARTSKVGIGPVAVLDYTIAGITARLEASMTFPPAWVDSNVRGKVLTAGLSVEPTKALHSK